MAASTGAFFAGVATTFAIFAVGFGGGLMIANSTLNEPSVPQSRAVSEAPAPVRVILPHPAEPAQPHQGATPPEPATPPAVQQPAKQAPVEKQVENLDTKKAEAGERERKRRYAERKAKRQAVARARQQREQPQPRVREGAPIVSFGDGERPPFGGGLFGN
jgi:type IV secretory pathway VirB10-like protein